MQKLADISLFESLGNCSSSLFVSNVGTYSLRDYNYDMENYARYLDGALKYYKILSTDRTALLQKFKAYCDYVFQTAIKVRAGIWSNKGPDGRLSEEGNQMGGARYGHMKRMCQELAQAYEKLLGQKPPVEKLNLGSQYYTPSSGNLLR